MYPGDFGNPEMDINCRCVVIQRAKWALNEDELAELKRRAEYYGLDKTDSFNDFKKKYVQINDTRGIIGTDRNLAMGLRQPPSHILTDSEIKNIKNDAQALGIDESLLQFNSGNATGFSESESKIYVKGDILPDLASEIPRDTMSTRAVLAHEYYGHYCNSPSQLPIGDWRDEFRASYDAALNAPNLSNEDRRYLMLDAYDRAKEAGISVKYNEKVRKIISGY